MAGSEYTKYLQFKYEKHMKKINETERDNDGKFKNDLGLAYNIYNQIIEAYNQLHDAGIHNPYILVAVNQMVKQDKETIDRILVRFGYIQKEEN